jgi:PhzF family phenazine biosynthesis protein
MNPSVHQVDAFTDRPFAGNPAGVVPLERPLDGADAERWMQTFAAEMNLAETAYLWPAGEAFRLRWFTPAVEVRLCGHGTLAAAHVLWESGRLAAGEAARFDTLSGRLTCTRRADGAIDMEFPARPSRPVAAPPELFELLGVPEGGRPVATRQDEEDYLVELDSAETVRRLRPDLVRLGQVTAATARGVIVTALSDGHHDCDFVSRFFAPAVGIPEDPVTGSAHCSLAAFWCERLGRDELVGYQASARGGRVGVRLAGDRVTLTGRAVTVFRGELASPPPR